MQDPHTMNVETLKDKSFKIADALGTPLTGTAKWKKADWLANCLLLVFTYRQQAADAAAEAAALQTVCTVCNGEGTYDGGHWVGKCFRCDGKGYQDDTDKLRNAKYDRYHPATPVEADASTVDVTDITENDDPF